MAWKEKDDEGNSNQESSLSPSKNSGNELSENIIAIEDDEITNALQNRPKTGNSKIPYVKPFPENVLPTDKWEQWVKWERQFEIACSLLDNLTERQKAANLYIAVGEEVCNIIDLNGFFPNPANVPPNYKFYTKMTENLNRHFRSLADATVDAKRFKEMKQAKEQNIVEYDMVMKRFARRCGIDPSDQFYRFQFLEGMKDRELAKESYEKGTPLNEILEVSMRKESNTTVTKQESNFDPWHVPQPSVSQIERRRQPSRYERKWQRERNENSNFRARPYARDRNRRSQERDCGRCGFSAHKLDVCPARKKMCNKCHSIGHFERKCRSTGESEQSPAAFESQHDIKVNN